MTTALVTGATRGIGREVARRLVEAGLTVHLAGRDADRAAAVAAEVGASPVRLDVTDAASIAEAVRAVGDAGGLDVLVNNAGVAGDQRPPAEQTSDDLRRVLETNVVGATAVLTAFTPLLEGSGAPVVVNVSSAVGSLALNSQPGSAWTLLAYPMSKAALNMLTVQYAKAFPRWRVNAATPGLTATDFLPGLRQDPPAHANTVEQGAEVIVRLALIGPDGPTGGFERNEGPVPW